MQTKVHCTILCLQPFGLEQQQYRVLHARNRLIHNYDYIIIYTWMHAHAYALSWVSHDYIIYIQRERAPCLCVIIRVCQCKHNPVSVPYWIPNAELTATHPPLAQNHPLTCLHTHKRPQAVTTGQQRRCVVGIAKGRSLLDSSALQSTSAVRQDCILQLELNHVY